MLHPYCLPLRCGIDWSWAELHGGQQKDSPGEPVAHGVVLRELDRLSSLTAARVLWWIFWQEFLQSISRGKVWQLYNQGDLPSTYPRLTRRLQLMGSPNHCLLILQSDFKEKDVTDDCRKICSGIKELMGPNQHRPCNHTVRTAVDVFRGTTPTHQMQYRIRNLINRVSLWTAFRCQDKCHHGEGAQHELHVQHRIFLL